MVAEEGSLIHPYSIDLSLFLSDNDLRYPRCYPRIQFFLTNGIGYWGSPTDKTQAVPSERLRSFGTEVPHAQQFARGDRALPCLRAASPAPHPYPPLRPEAAAPPQPKKKLDRRCHTVTVGGALVSDSE